MVNIFSFQKEDVEKQALALLKEHDSIKYSNAVLADKPDIQDKISNIGVEVVTADFKDNTIMSELQKKSFLQILKMTNCPSIKAKKVKHLTHQNRDTFNFLLEEEPYIEMEKQATPLLDIETLFELKDNRDIYLTKYKKFNHIEDENGEIKFVIPPAQWVGNLPQIMLERYREKNKKLKTYKRFKEMNLYIHTLMADIDEIEDFRKVLKEEVKINKTDYCIVYVLNNWGRKELIEIVL